MTKFTRGSIAGLLLALAAPGLLRAQTAAPQEKKMLEISRKASRPASPAPADHFTGTVLVEPLFGADNASPMTCGNISFQPGARSAWHTHPRGQMLIVTAGSGWVQQWGQPRQEMRQGDVVRIPAGEKHWHGATATSAMTHIALQEEFDGKSVQWLEKVTDEQYGAASAAEAPTAARQAFGDIAPALAGYTDTVLFGDVWKRPDLSPRDRSLVTVAALVALYRTNELPFHLARALENGVTKDELIELITHLAFYSGWPTANTALPIARRVLQEENPRHE